LTLDPRYTGTVDPVTKSVGPPPEWVRPSINPPRDNTEEPSDAISINATQKSGKSTVGSPGSGSPPLDLDGRPPRPVLEELPAHAIMRIGSGSGSMRNESPSGGVQMVLDEAGSWTNLADKSPTVPSKAKSSGMLGFMKRKGRSSSPKPQERGVLGREGARVIIA
jgi:serine/threonine kinase 32